MYYKKKYVLILIIIITFLNSLTVFCRSSYSIGYSSHAEPIQFTDEHSREDGIIIQLLKYLENNNNLYFNFFPVIHSDTNPHINNSNFDFNVTNFTHSTNSDIYTKSTIPFYNITLTLTGVANNNDTINENYTNIGILDYSSITDSDIIEKIPNAIVTYYANSHNLKQALLSNDVDFIFCDNNFNQEFLNNDTDNIYQSYPMTLKVPLKIYATDYIADSEIYTLNKLISDLDSNIINNIILENSSLHTDDISFSDSMNSYTHIKLLRTGFLTILIIICILMSFSYFYKKHLEKIIFYDRVTGFLSSYKFNLETSKLLKNATPFEYSIISIDIDNFQYINEVYSFDTGTYILKRFSEYLKKYYVSASLITRIHSDNFLILIKNDDLIVDDKHAPPNFNEEDFENVLGEYSHFYTSKGIYNIEDPTQALTSIIGCVNLARNLGKTTYGDTSILFTDNMDKKRSTQNKILSTMEQALKNKEFEVYYQPKVSLPDETVYGAEALIRWIVKDGDPIFPDEFIPLFEKNRYISNLDFYVFEEVCIFISNNKESLGDRVISVNLSTITLLQTDLINNLLTLLLKYNVPVNYIELEVTESAFVENLNLIMSQIHLLKKAGFVIALDDFGSGISSLNQLKNIELDVLKLDKAFLSDSLNQDKGILIVENVITLAKKLNLSIVAEGVEILDDVRLLTKLGCDIAQGYYYSKPIPKNEFLKFLKTDIKKSVLY